jgi:hypothetical protein
MAIGGHHSGGRARSKGPAMNKSIEASSPAPLLGIDLIAQM